MQHALLSALHLLESKGVAWSMTIEVSQSSAGPIHAPLWLAHLLPVNCAPCVIAMPCIHDFSLLLQMLFCSRHGTFHV
jgi:hypothetical protein